MNKKISTLIAAAFLGSSTLAYAVPSLSPIATKIPPSYPPMPIRIISQEKTYVIHDPHYKEVQCTVFLNNSQAGFIRTLKNNETLSIDSATVDHLCNQSSGQQQSGCTITERYVNCNHHLGAKPVTSTFVLLKKYYLGVPQSIQVDFYPVNQN